MLDLGKVQTIGRIEVKWQPPPETLGLSVSPDGDVWHEIYSGAPSEGYADWIVEHRSDEWHDLDVQSRFIRFVLTPKARSWGGVVAPLDDHIVGIARVSVFEKRRRPTAAGTTLLQTTGENEGYVWQIRPDGRVRFGRYVGAADSFHCEKERDIEVSFGNRATIRLVQRSDLVDLYVNDYQVDYYQLLGEPTGRFALVESTVHDAGRPTRIRVWYPD